MSNQIKVDDEMKREVELYAAFTGSNQKAVMATTWNEFKHNHADEFRKGIAWAESILGDPGAAAVASSGMSRDDIAEVDAAFNG